VAVNPIHSKTLSSPIDIQATRCYLAGYISLRRIDAMVQSPLAKMLDDKLEITKTQLVEAQRIAKEANEKAELLASKVDAYRKALAAETGEGTVQPEKTGFDSLFVGEPASEINKSQIVRDVIFAMAERGATTKDIREGITKSEVPFSHNYLYSVLQRLKRNQTIREARGKYYPMEPKKSAE
jgi:hypothetical protein